METQSHLSHPTRPIFGYPDSPPDLWNVDEIWLYKMEVEFCQTGEYLFVGLITPSSQLLVEDEFKRHLHNEGFSFEIKAGEKLDLSNEERGLPSSVKALEDFCQLLLEADHDELKDVSNSDAFLVPFFRQKIDWEGMIDLIEGIKAVKQGKDLEALESVCTTPAMTSDPKPTTHSQKSRLIDYLDSMRQPHNGSEARCAHSENAIQTRLLGFWSIATCTRTILRHIQAPESDSLVGIARCKEEYLTKVMKELSDWKNRTDVPKTKTKTRTNKNLPKTKDISLSQHIGQVGRAFMKMTTSVPVLIQHPEESMERLTDLRSQVIQNSNIELLERVWTPKTSKLFKQISFIIGACYLSGKSAPALILARRLNLCSMSNFTNVDWLAYCSNLDLEEQPDPEKTSDLQALEASLQHEFKNKTLIQKILWPDTDTVRRLEWIGDCLLDLWAAERLMRMGKTTTGPKKGLGPAFKELTWNPTLAVWADKWLHPHKRLVKGKMKTGAPDDVVKASADLVECLVFVFFLECGCVLGPNSTFYQILDRIFEEKCTEVSAEHFANISESNA